MIKNLKDNLNSISRFAKAALPIVKLVTALINLFKSILGF